MCSTTDANLAAAFAVHADEALALANEAFPAAAETWLRVCVWPACLTETQSAQLVKEIEYDLRGEKHPDSQVYDKRAECGCDGA